MGPVGRKSGGCVQRERGTRIIRTSCESSATTRPLLVTIALLTMAIWKSEHEWLRGQVRGVSVEHQDFLKSVNGIIFEQNFDVVLI
jgi:hypothetical protein